MAIDHIIEEAERLSLEDLEAAHRRIEEIISTRKWDEIWKNPKAIEAAQKLAEESRSDEIEGEGFDDL